jgi:hypothetical protein
MEKAVCVAQTQLDSGETNEGSRRRVSMASARSATGPGPSAFGEGHLIPREGSKPYGRDAARLGSQEPAAAHAARAEVQAISTARLHAVDTSCGHPPLAMGCRSDNGKISRGFSVR